MLSAGAMDGDTVPVDTYIKRGGSITRALTVEESRLLSCEAYTVDPAQTLLHLTIRHSNHNVAVVLLSHQQQVIIIIIRYFHLYNLSRT